MNFNDFLEISDEVKNALIGNKPVVALESTIISHGMPYPQNVKTALEVEKIVRENGAIPATIAIINGKLKVGLTKEEIDYLGKKGTSIPKVSRRDIAPILSKQLDGATTVASTMIIANLSNIRIFATGGIGGVHRNATTTMDISADLEELATTNVAVVCAGAKSILDLGLTLEFLETKGVPIIGYQTNELPAFYTRKSGFKVDYKMDSPEEIAKTLKIKWQMSINGGVIVANPIPEKYALDYTYINSIIEKALVESNSLGIKGKEITPFLLSKVKDLTEGKSLEANIKLVFNNAKLAAQIACELKNL